MELKEQNLGEELYNLLAELLNSKMNRTVMDSIRGEYGVLRYLCYIEDHVHAGKLTEHLRVVPGRMTDILNSLEAKGLITRIRGEEDRRHVNVCITEEGKKQAVQMRQMISREYEGMFRILGQKDTEELIRLLKIVLSYPDAKETKRERYGKMTKDSSSDRENCCYILKRTKRVSRFSGAMGTARLSHCRIWWMVLR